MEKKVKVNFRLPESMVKDIEKLTEQYKIIIGPDFTQSDVLRVVIRDGLKFHGNPKKVPTKPKRIPRPAIDCAL